MRVHNTCKAEWSIPFLGLITVPFDCIASEPLCAVLYTLPLSLSRHSSAASAALCVSRGSFACGKSSFLSSACVADEPPSHSFLYFSARRRLLTAAEEARSARSFVKYTWY